MKIPPFLQVIKYNQILLFFKKNFCRFRLSKLSVIIVTNIRISQIDFDEVFGEPDGVHSMDCVWTNSYKCFTCGKNCCYQTITFICSIFIALAWGCEFGMTAFWHIWLCTPLLRWYSIWCGMLQKCCGTTINCFLSPTCEVCGLFLSSMRLRQER